MMGIAKPGVFIFVLVVVFGVAGGVLAYNRGRSLPGWCILCALCPLFLVVIYFLKPLREVPGAFKRCGSCGQFIRWRDAACRHCGATQP
jgi:hypothetical protein